MDTGLVSISDGVVPQAESFALLEFSRDTSLASGTQAVTGVGLKPSAVILFGVVNAAVGRASWGMDTITDAVASADQHATTADTYLADGSNSIYCDQGSGNAYSGNVQSFDSDGFTIDWTKTSSPTGTLTILALCYK